MTDASEMTDLALRGVHHVRIPVSDLKESFEWYNAVLGYEREFDFAVMGCVAWALKPSQGGTPIVLVADPDRAAAMKDFQLIAFGVASEHDLDLLKRRIGTLDGGHTAIQKAMFGSKLPDVTAPGGVRIGFYMKPAAP
jgi:catechol 2,3-dioxygenase-like lactoylglutathione lyase family enzyme